ncbi:hypothetical protein ASD45_19165 [Pseudolabrys sp. Root1462]|uniref:hypothetical protein n=1 Tax=Pseudolabrys sp. Root1462 TaxID=1736466 RepID=UPI0007029334|nr:hypothetical protein [Pseudolabrys sp. Root1462]KQY98101.1 hypothetical protein ASD45_19165 [Pseudolabrys sp. Root1462]
MKPKERARIVEFAAKLPAELGSELIALITPKRGAPRKERLFGGTYKQLLTALAIIEYRDLIADNWDNEEALGEIERKHANRKIGLAEGTIRQACIKRGGSQLPKIVGRLVDERKRIAASYGLEAAMKMLRTKIEQFKSG